MKRIIAQARKELTQLFRDRLTVLLVSKMTPTKIPSDVAQVRLRMHAPDGLGLTRDRAVASFGTAEERSRLADGRHRK